MAIFKKNIWSLFYVLILLMTIGFTFLLFNIYSITKHEIITEQENLTKLKSKSIKSIFSEYEVILDIVGNHLIKNSIYNKKNLSQAMLDEVLLPNSNIIAFSLVKPNGNIYAVSSNLSSLESQFFNLNEKEETKDSFAQTIKSNTMVLGRTYYSDALKQYVLPARKAFFNANNELAFVIVAVVNPSTIYDFKNDEKYHHILFRDVDYFYQIFSERDNKKSIDYYEKAIPKKLIDGIKMDAQKTYKKPISLIQEEELMVTVKGKNYLLLGVDFISAQYIKRYALWAVTQVPAEIVNQVFIKKASYLVALQLLVFLILYFLVKNISESEEKKKNALEYQAHHDYLTGLHNRLFLVKQFESNPKEPYTIFFIDMDNFKSINDSYGHEYGDKLLKKISSRLSELKKEEDYLVRYSGDEFLLIVFNINNELIKSRAQAVIDLLGQPYDINPYRFHLGSSIGIAKYPENGNDIEEVKRFADIAMYESKKEKNRFTIFEEGIKNRYLHRIAIEHELKRSLQNNEIYMMYQPQVDIHGRLYGVEALVRWENEKLGFVPPDVFIEIAEATGYMGQLGDFIIEQSLEEISRLQQELQVDFQLSINISVKQFMEQDFYSKMVEYIQKSTLQSIKLTLEVTENVCIEDLEYITEILEQLRACSMKISLDDFGTGYSSLSLLKNLPIDELKVDKSFVDDVLSDKSSRMMVKNIINIGTNLDFTVLAEGIEALEQKEILQAYGCTLFQGYYYSKPLKLNDLKEYIKKENNTTH